jgi:hypothetical protein
MAEGSTMVEKDDCMPAQCVSEWEQRMEIMVRMVRVNS